MNTLPNDFWYTNSEVWRAILDFMPNVFDPCPDSPTFDGLTADWGKDCYINPPYSKKLKRAFVNKAFEQYTGGRFLWMFNYANSQDLWRVHSHASAILIPETRFEFVAGHPDLKVSSPRYDNIMILWGDNRGFEEAFGKYGKVYYNQPGGEK